MIIPDDHQLADLQNLLRTELVVPLLEDIKRHPLGRTRPLVTFKQRGDLTIAIVQLPKRMFLAGELSVLVGNIMYCVFRQIGPRTLLAELPLPPGRHCLRLGVQTDTGKVVPLPIFRR